MAKTDGGFSQRGESTPGRDNPGSNRDLIKQIKDGKWGGQPDEVRQTQSRVRNSLGCPAVSKAQTSGGGWQAGAPS